MKSEPHHSALTSRSSTKPAHHIGDMNTPGQTPAQRVIHTSDAFFRQFIHVWLAYSALLTGYTYVWEPDSLYAGLVSAACGILAKVFLHQGYTTLVRWLFITPCFIMLMVAPWLVNGIRTPLLMHAIPLLIFTGWMLGTRALWSFALGLSANGLAIWYAERYGLWQMPQALREIDMWLIALQISLILSTTVMAVLLRNYQADIQRESTWQNRLQQAMQLNALVIDSSPVPIRVFGPQGQCLAVNDAYAKLMGQSRATLLTENLWHHAMPITVLTQACLQALETGQAAHSEIEVTTTDGRILWLGVHLEVFDREGQRHLLAHLMDLTEHRRATLELKQLAFYDSLTGLANRRLFWEHFQRIQLLCARQQQWGAVLLLDLNRFKQLNDEHGHEAGDQMLKEVARRMQHTVRASDVIARLGGDEFTLLLPNLGNTQPQAHLHVQMLCNKLHAALSQPYQLGTTSHPVSASIGFALIDPAQDHDLDSLLHQADTQMYAQKKTLSAHLADITMTV